MHLSSVISNAQNPGLNHHVEVGGNKRSPNWAVLRNYCAALSSVIPHPYMSKWYGLARPTPRLVPMGCPLYDEYTTVRRSISLLPDEVHKIQADLLVHGMNMDRKWVVYHFFCNFLQFYSNREKAD